MPTPCRLLAIVLTILISGCFGPRRARINMEPLLIEVGSEGVPYRVFSPRDLLREANADTDCDSAIRQYREILRDFPDTRQALDARYNLGLCEESRKNFETALGEYKTLIARTSRGSDLWIDASLRRAYCLEKLDRAGEAAAAYKALARQRGLSDELKLGAQLRYGIALMRTGEIRRAEKKLRRALNSADSLETLGPSIRASAAEASFVRGEVAEKVFENLPLRFPQDTLSTDIAAKGDALLRARNHYVFAMKFRDAAWAATSAVHVGGLYETLHDQISDLPEPTDTSVEVLAIYQGMLAQRLVPLRQQAFHAYLQVLLLAERVGFSNSDVDQARERVRVLEPLLKERVVEESEALDGSDAN